MQNVWKSIVVFMIAATVEAGNVEPVLMKGGAPIEDKVLFHRVHGIVRDWQYNLLYKPKASFDLEAALAAEGVEAIMVPTTLWQLIFCEVNLSSIEFEQTKTYAPWGEDGHTTELVDESLAPIYLQNYAPRKGTFGMESTDQESYDRIHQHTKHPRMSRLKQLVDQHIVTHYGRATALDISTPDSWGGIVRASIANIKTIIESAPKNEYDECVYAAKYSTRLPLPHNFTVKLDRMLEAMDNIRQILNYEHATFRSRALILMRGTSPMVFKAPETEYVLPDSPIKLSAEKGGSVDPYGKETGIIDPEYKQLHSPSYAASFLGGLMSRDNGANPLSYWGPVKPMMLLGLPAGLTPAIRDVFWLPPLFGPLEMIRAGEYHPRVKTLSGIHVVQGSYADSTKLETKPPFHAHYSTTVDLARHYHQLIAAHLMDVVPCGSYPHDASFFKENSARFAADVDDLAAARTPMTSSYLI